MKAERLGKLGAAGRKVGNTRDCFEPGAASVSFDLIT